MPPVFIFGTSEDEKVPVKNSLIFSLALANADIPFEMHIFQKGCHGLSLAKECTSSGEAKFVNSAAAGWFKMSIDWLTDILKS